MLQSCKLRGFKSALETIQIQTSAIVKYKQLNLILE